MVPHGQWRSGPPSSACGSRRSRASSGRDPSFRRTTRTSRSRSRCTPMVERQASGAPEAGGGPVDGELDFRGILVFVGGLTAITLVVMGLMWGVAVLFKGSLARKDPAPPALAEARAPGVRSEE